MAVEVITQLADPFRGVAFARSRGECIERQDDDPSGGLSVTNCEFTKSEIIGDENSSSFGSQSENLWIGLAGADLLCVHDVQAIAPHFPDNFSGDTFICEVARHDRYSAAEMLSCAK